MRELSKSIARRMHDPGFTCHYFRGRAIDIGGGPDPLSQYVHLFPLMTSCDIWDRDNGDAQYVTSVDDDTYDLVHSSHTLEHMVDPRVALTNWVRILKPGGHLVCMVPDEMLYEHGMWPSRFNSDHKFSFRIGGPSKMPRSIELSSMLFVDGIQILSLRLLHETYRYGEKGDQTLGPVAECAIEFVLRKTP